MAAFVALVVASGLVVDLVAGTGPVGLALAVVVAAAGAAGAYWRSDALALALSHARPADPVRHARFHNLVEGLCIAGGLPKPRLFVIEDPAPNAFAIGRDPRHASLVVTTGLLDRLNRVELEGALAHELSHIRSYDVLPATLAVSLVGALLPPPLVARGLRAAVGTRREALADMAGVAITRYPPGLLSALEKLRDDTTVLHSASRATAHLWLESPVARLEPEGRRAWLTRRSDVHPPLEERIEALREL